MKLSVDRPLPIDSYLGRLVIEGPARVEGEVQVGGAKNAALPILAACLLTSDWCVVSNVPDIEDIHTMLDVLEHLGVEVNRLGSHEVALRAREITQTRTPSELASRMRASFLVLGPLLSRAGRAEAPHPGGCAIGVRPVNVDVNGFAAMGAKIDYEDGCYVARADSLSGRRIYLDYPSHTGTENLLMAACLAKGTTVIKHASMEPEVVDLARFLVQMGAKIHGIGTSVLEVEGVSHLHGTTYQVMPDRLIAGTFLIAAAISGGRVVVRGVVPEHLDPVTYKLNEAGARATEGGDYIVCEGGGELNAVDIQAIHYPGFPTDLQAPSGALLTQAEGVSVIHERVFENRLLYANELAKMGGHIEVEGQMARVHGPTPLRGAQVRALDIRSGTAVVLAALAASGTTVIDNAYHLDRGYEDLVGVLGDMGVNLHRN